MTKPLEVLSLGAGVQSTALLLMSCEGELPKLDHAIFADVGWEPKSVYKHLEWLKGYAEEHGIPVHIVNNGNVRDDIIAKMVNMGENGRFASMPFHTIDAEGNRGLTRRQCTREYKIEPIEKFLRREVMGLAPRQRAPKEPVIRQWRGISVDEWKRIRKSDHKWMTVWHPLVEQRITRNGCHAWMANNGFPDPPRSACLGCPFHADKEWRLIRDESPEEWADVVAFDKAIRKCGGMRGDNFLHRSCVPLDEVDLRTPEDHGQLSLWDDECYGMCGN